MSTASCSGITTERHNPSPLKTTGRFHPLIDDFSHFFSFQRSPNWITMDKMGNGENEEQKEKGQENGRKGGDDLYRANAVPCCVPNGFHTMYCLYLLVSVTHWHSARWAWNGYKPGLGSIPRRGRINCFRIIGVHALRLISRTGKRVWRCPL